MSDLNELIPLYLNRSKWSYDNKITGTAFRTREEPGKLDIAIRASNDWRDWIRNFSQLIGIFFSIWILSKNVILGSVFLFVSLTVHFGFAFAGLEVLFVLLFRYKLDLFYKLSLRFIGHSLGGAITQFVVTILYVFGKRGKIKGYTTGAPKPFSCLNPLYLLKKYIPIINFINPEDIVPKSPPKFLGFLKHMGKQVFLKRFGFSKVSSHDFLQYKIKIELFYEGR